VQRCRTDVSPRRDRRARRYRLRCGGPPCTTADHHRSADSARAPMTAHEQGGSPGTGSVGAPPAAVRLSGRPASSAGASTSCRCAPEGRHGRIPCSMEWPRPRCRASAGDVRPAPWRGGRLDHGYRPSPGRGRSAVDPERPPTRYRLHPCRSPPAGGRRDETNDRDDGPAADIHSLAGDLQVHPGRTRRVGSHRGPPQAAARGGSRVDAL
jgi:hypothetical protein